MTCERLEAERLEGEARLYRFGGGEWLPSVTAILEKTRPVESRRAIEAWRARVGAAEADRVRAEAAARGSAVHQEVEAHLLDPFRPPEGPVGLPVDPSPWVASLRGILEMIERPILVEGPVWHSKGFAGTLDLLAEGRAGKLALVDWKTAEIAGLDLSPAEARSAEARGGWRALVRRRTREQIRDYELQAAAYTAAARERYGLEIEAACVAIAYDDGGPADLFWLDGQRLRAMWGAFLMRLGEFKARARTAPEPWDAPGAYDGV